MGGSGILGVSIGPHSLAQLTAACDSAFEGQRNTFVFACANPHSLVLARRDAQFLDALKGASAVVADGVGCRIAARLVGTDVGPRITGSDFFRETMANLDRRCGKAYFFGSQEGVLRKLMDRLDLDFPNVRAKFHSPPYHDWSAAENEIMLQDIREFAPDVLWVGMTAPKQEKWVAANVEVLPVPVIGSIGAVFDYYAGVTHRAPPWICKLGLEWLYRLPREPKRLWRRTFISAPQFMWYVLLERAAKLSLIRR